MANQRFFLFLSSLLLIGLTGCGDGSSSGAPEIPEELKVKNPVKGQVIMEGGRSPVGTLVKFYTMEETDTDRIASRGGCDAFGYFSMSTGSQGDGVPPGKYKVLLFQTGKPSRGSGRPSPVDALGGVYHDINNPQFEVDIPQGGKEDLQFKVTPLSQEEIDAAIEEYKENRTRDRTRDSLGKGND
ncbi:MAG: hypothetical protein KDA68_07770 [Planctomycetaceae bacterium]|nr:hypothetical protein [Planctomycetaceae bacterium]